MCTCRYLLQRLLSGCATQPLKNDLSAFYAHKPRSILVVLILNESPENKRFTGFRSTITRPLAERGYYVFPVFLTDLVLRDLGLAEAGHIHQLPTQRFYELFGADAVLLITIKVCSSKYLVLPRRSM
ncbi:MAG: GNA1162 family protein [Nitrosospira sp.]